MEKGKRQIFRPATKEEIEEIKKKLSPRKRFRPASEDEIKELKKELRFSHGEFPLEDQTKERAWSKKHEKCINRGTTEIEHRGGGLCIKCYNRRSEKRRKTHPRKRGVASKILTREYLMEEYVKNKKSLSDIAKECYCTRQYVYKRMTAYQIPTRDISAATRQVQFDENFFSSWSPEMAWVLGIIYTDGTLSLGVKGKYPYFSIPQKEPEILDKIKALMKCDAKLFFRPRRNYKGDVVAGELYTLQIVSQKAFSDLVELGLKPKKTFRMEFPWVPQKCVRHFIRGCWDGDGGVYLEKGEGQRPKIRAVYTCGSLQFIRGMLFELEKAGFWPRNIYAHKRKNLSYYFRFGESQCQKLYHYLYDGVPAEQYMQRKHDVFKNHFYGIA